MNNERYALSLELAAHAAIAERLFENRLITPDEFKIISRYIAQTKKTLITGWKSTHRAHTRKVEEKNPA